MWKRRAGPEPDARLNPRISEWPGQAGGADPCGPTEGLASEEACGPGTGAGPAGLAQEGGPDFDPSCRGRPVARIRVVRVGIRLVDGYTGRRGNAVAPARAERGLVWIERRPGWIFKFCGGVTPPRRTN